MAAVLPQWPLSFCTVHASPACNPSKLEYKILRARHKPKKKMGRDRGLLEEETSTAKKTTNMAADDCLSIE